MQEFLDFAARHWRTGLQILILSVVVFFVYRRFGSRRWARGLATVAALLLVLLLISHALQLAVVRWLVIAFTLCFTMALIVVFQPELRRAMAEFGSRGFLFFQEDNKEFAADLAEVIRQLAAKRYGALFAIERRIELKPHLETGVDIDAKFSKELVLTIFHPKTELHDGGMVMREGRVLGAGCVFPVSQRELSDRSLGLRHRAGLGITEESDAIAIVVSEETGNISICHEGELERDLEPEDLKRRLGELLELGDGEQEGAPDGQETGAPQEDRADDHPKRKASASDTRLLSGGAGG